MIIQELANKVKDAAVQHVAKWFANHYHLKKLGRLTDLKFDSAAREIFVVLDLHGEEKSLEMTLRYRILTPTLLEIEGVKASRQWITELVNHVIPPEQKRVEVTPMITKVLSKLER